MDTKTVLSSHISTFMEKWNAYKRGLKGLKFKDWVICSDYCLDDKQKLNDVITFTIFPQIKPSIIIDAINQHVPADIKNVKHFSQKTLEFLRNSPYFFHIVILLENKENLLKKEELIKMSNQLVSIYKRFSEPEKEDNKQIYHKIQSFLQYLKQKRCSKKLLSTLMFVSQYISMIFEFLLIKEKGNDPFWCSDRDSIILFNDGIIYNFIQSKTHVLIKNRIANYHTHMAKCFDKEFSLDPIIRIPDIICGVLSSVKYIDGNFRYDKEKHRELFLNVILDNPKLLILQASFDKTGKESLIQHEYYNITSTPSPYSKQMKFSSY